MSIASSITGGEATSQLMDLLAVVANPAMYKSKIDALEAATAENKKYVEAIGPASEIFVLRDEAKAVVQAAKDALAQAKSDAAQALQLANERATGITEAAQKTADSLIAAATVAKDEAELAAKQNKAALAEAKKATAAASTAQALAESKVAELTKAINDSVTAKAQADAAKAGIIAKHEAFIKGL